MKLRVRELCVRRSGGIGGWLLWAGLILPLGGGAAHAQVLKQDFNTELGVDVAEQLGTVIPLDLHFISGDGDSVTLGDYFRDQRPVILILGYYTCPMLCNLVFNGVAEAARGLAWTPGKEFQIVTVSIDPRDSPAIASAKRKNYQETLEKPGMPRSGWDFLTGTGTESAALAKAVGWRYRYDEAQKQYAHPAVIMILGGDGKISRYLYGIQFKTRDLRLALTEASDGKVGSTIDRIVLSCYHYDPEASGYVVFAGGLMRLGGAITLVLLLLFLTVLFLRERRRRTAGPADGAGTIPRTKVG